jgi:hypothetical protein
LADSRTQRSRQSVPHDLAQSINDEIEGSSAVRIEFKSVDDNVRVLPRVGGPGMDEELSWSNTIRSACPLTRGGTLELEGRVDGGIYNVN